MQAGWTDLGSFDMGIGDTHTNFRRMVAKDGCKARCGKDRSFVRLFVRPIVRRMVAKDGCKGWLRSKVRQGSFVRPIVRSSDSSKDGCKGWLRRGRKGSFVSDKGYGDNVQSSTVQSSTFVSMNKYCRTPPHQVQDLPSARACLSASTLTLSGARIQTLRSDVSRSGRWCRKLFPGICNGCRHLWHCGGVWLIFDR